MTNFELMKDLTIEEMADFITVEGLCEGVGYDSKGEFIPVVCSCYYSPVGELSGETREDAVKEVLEWLKREI